MKLTIDIPDELLREVVLRTGAATESEAVAFALSDWVRQRKLADLSAQLGTSDGYGPCNSPV